MAEVSLDKLWDWWRELAMRQVSLERQWKPLLAESQETDAQRHALENLMINLIPNQNQDERNKLAQQFQLEQEKIRKGEPLPAMERRPMDVAYEILVQTGKPMHYTEILSQLATAGVIIGGQDPRSTLLAYLGRDKRFTKAKEVKRGVWKLSEIK